MNTPSRTDSRGVGGHRIHRLALGFLVVGCLSLTASAQTGGAGTIIGRIFNPATQEYVRNAEIRVEGANFATFSGDDGSYVIAGVPPGEVTLAVTYTGYDRATARLSVAGGQTHTRDFELQGSTFKSAAKDAAIVLDQFVVSSEREGNAKAIMEQRAALNMKNVVAADNFGDVTGGNIGEFIKYLPGVVMDYNNADARAARIGGLDASYVGVTIDGMNVASAASASFSGTSRQFEFEQASIYGTDAIEISKTTTASMDADAPAGRINLRSRNAFDRKGREITAQFTLSANAYALDLERTPGPYKKDEYKTLPSFVFTYADSFQQRFGLQLSVGASSLFTTQSEVTPTQNFTNAARGPVVTQIQFRDAPIRTTRSSFNLATDYRLTPQLSFALRTAGSNLDGATNNRTMTLVAALAQIDPASTATRVIALPTANANTRLEMTTARRTKRNDTISYAPRLEYKRGDLNLTAAGVFSRSRTAYEDLDEGMFSIVSTRLTRMGWTASRSAPNSGDWHLEQTSGPSWLDGRNYNRPDTNPNNIASNPQSGRNKLWAGQFDAKKTVALGLPIQFHTGVKSRLTTFDLEKTGSRQWTYVGPTGSQIDPTTVVPTSTHLPFDPKQGGNVPVLAFPRPDPYGTYELYAAHPEYFAPNAINNHIVDHYSARSVKEQIDAAFIEANTRWNMLRFNLGVRHERTRTVGKTYDLLPAGAVRAAGYTPNTIPYTDYQYRNGQRDQLHGGYGNTFLSGGAKYSLTPNLQLQVAGSQSIRRPGYNNLAGVVTVDEVAGTVQVPNPELKPETSDKFYVSLQYYIEPAGLLSVSGYRLFLENMGSRAQEITAAAAGYADAPEYAGYRFLRVGNAPGTRRLDGFDVEYSQQLVFLPGFLRGFSVFGSLSRTIAQEKITSHVPKSANGGLRFRNQRFNAQLRSTWVSARLNSVNATTGLEVWQYERIMFDFSGGWRLSPTYELTLTGRNILNSPIANFAGEPGILRTKARFGAAWTLGLRGRF